MYLTYDHKLGAYLFICSYIEKDVPKSLGFQWNPSKIGGKKAWFTFSVDTAIKALNIADDKTKDFISQQLVIREEKIKESHAETTDKVYEAPNGLKYYPFQNAGIEFLIKHPNTMLFDEMGCIGGDAVIIINRGRAAKRYLLRDLYIKYNHLEKSYYKEHKSRYNWDDTTPSLTKSLDSNGILGLNKIEKVIYKGVKNTIKIKTKSGKELVLTPDHEVLTKDGWKEIGKLSIGDSIKINGKPVCKICGSDENVAVSSQAKFKGYCKKCMYRYKRSMPFRKEGRFIDKDGYVQISGIFDHPRLKNRKITMYYEHVIVMENHLGRFLDKEEIVHHKNGIKSDNRIENLELTTIHDHMRLCHTGMMFRLQKNNSVWFIPKLDEITSIEENGVTDVYDIIMADPNRNFVTSGIIVHNCGKTPQVIGLINNTDVKKVLVVCPNVVKLNWKLECEKWLCKQLMISVISPQKYVEADIMIINYDLLVKYEKKLLENYWDLIVADESHLVSNKSAQRTKAINKILKNAHRKVFLTGTPILNRPIELWNAIQQLCPDEFESYYHFGKEFCGGYQKRIGYDRELNEYKYAWDFSGASNLEILQSKLRAGGMIRRLKKDVLKELPSVTRQIIILNDEKAVQYEKKLVEEVKKEFCEQVDSLTVNLTEIKAKLFRIRHETALKKVPKAIEFIENVLENESKTVVFAHHKDVIQLLRDKWPDAVVSTGDNTDEEKQKAVYAFQNDPKVRLFIGSIHASGVGINLTAASTEIFVEEDWVPANISQCEARLDRIGQKNAVNVYHLVFDDSIDAHLAKTIVRKQEIADIALDKPIDLKEIFNLGA